MKKPNRYYEEADKIRERARKLGWELRSTKDGRTIAVPIKWYNNDNADRKDKGQ